MAGSIDAWIGSDPRLTSPLLAMWLWLLQYFSPIWVWLTKMSLLLTTRLTLTALTSQALLSL